MQGFESDAVGRVNAENQSRVSILTVLKDGLVDEKRRFDSIDHLKINTNKVK